MTPFMNVARVEFTTKFSGKAAGTTSIRVCGLCYASKEKNNRER